ncbi:MAG: PAS domain-containing protein [Cyanobacteriota bacterium]|nr:PAS domain-containing protein [Cyanobacteriota bacterium]
MKLDSWAREAIDFHPLTAFPETPISEVIDRLLKTQASCVLAIESANSAKLVGLLSERDLLAAISSGASDTDLTVRQVMKVPTMVLNVSQAQNLSVLLDRFRQSEVRELPIVDARDRLVGLVTQKTLLQALEPETAPGNHRLRAANARLERELKSRVRAEQILEMRENRLQWQQIVLVELSKCSEFHTGNLQGALQKLTQTASHTLDVDLVSIWFYNDDRTLMECADLYELARRQHSSIMGLEVASHPKYFQSLELGKSIVTEDARRHPRLQAGISTGADRVTSVLDVPIRAAGRTIGVLGLDRIGERRPWMLEEQNFANYLAYMASLAREARDRTRAELALQQSEERYALATAQSQVGVWDWYLGGEQLYLTPNLKAMLGYADSKIPNSLKSWLDRVHPDDRKSAIAAARAYIIEGNSACEMSHRMLHRDGSTRWILWRGMAFRDLDGKLARVAGTATDITQLKQAEEALRATQQRLGYLLTSSPAVIYSRRPDGDCATTFISDNIEEILGYSADRWLTQPTFWRDRLHLEDAPRVLESLANLGEREDRVNEYRFRHRDGEYRWLRDEVRVVRDETGNSVEWIGSLIDISDRKQAEEEVRVSLAKERELNELKSRFVTMTSHEFRTPLAIIKSSAQLLERYDWERSQQLEQLGQILSASQHMTHLLDDVLTLGRAEAGKLEFDPQPLELTPFFDRLVSEICAGLGGDRIVEQIVEPPDVEIVPLMDEKLLRQILDNLLANAIKYSALGSSIRATLRYHQDRVVFQIQDRGIGIPPEDLSHLFESFHRAKNVGTIPGTGLGLAIVKRCVELHGGVIKVTSQVGIGTTFTVTLPLNSEREHEENFSH